MLGNTKIEGEGCEMGLYSSSSQLIATTYGKHLFGISAIILKSLDEIPRLCI